MGNKSGIETSKTNRKGVCKNGDSLLFGIYHGTGEVLVNGCEWEVLFIMDVRQDLQGLMVINDLPLNMVSRNGNWSW